MQTDRDSPHPSTQSEGLICAIRYLGFLFQTTTASVVAEPPYRSSLSRCRFGRSGSRGFVGRLLRLRLISRGLAPRVHSFRDRCRYRYIWPSQTNPVSSSRSSERQKLPAFHTHPMSGLEVLCRLWLAYWVENQFTIHLD